MTLIVHNAYPADGVHYAKTAEESRRPGACLGSGITHWKAMRDGDVVTNVHDEAGRSLYYFDPLVYIVGEHYVRAHGMWIRFPNDDDEPVSTVELKLNSEEVDW